VTGSGLQDVEIHGVAAGGAGVGRLSDGRVVFVHRTAPGDRVRVQLTMEKDRWARGRRVALPAPGPGRRTPPCTYYDRCGGCTLQHLEPEVQLQARGTLVREALTRIGKLDGLPPVELHPAPSEFGYRNRASFTLRRLGVRTGTRGGERTAAEARVLAGFHALERPDRLVDIGGGEPCLLLEPAVAGLWRRLREAWGPNASRLPAGAELRLTLRGLSDGTGVLLVEGGGGAGDPDGLMADVPGLRAIWSRPGPGGSPVLLAGEEAPQETWFGERVPVRPGAFLQVSREGAHLLHALALAELDPQPGERVVDGYCGFGVYGRAAARRGARAVGIELDPEAVAMGRARPVDGFELQEGAVELRIPGTLPADRVILNPPRGGVAPGVMEALAASPPRRLVYVSCDPATLARDLRRLGPAFRVARIQAVDLFPQTSHVETVVTLHPLPATP
jgi:23S rRNA (uracil1939-C5)-methyltransferase